MADESGAGSGRGDVAAEPEDEAPRQPATAEYIADLASQLAGLARGAGLGFVAQLLDMARIEANAAARPARRTR